MATFDKEALCSGTISTTTGAITGQAITATAVSTNTYDAGVARDLGPGEELDFFVSTDAAFNTLTSLTIDLITATDAALTTSIVVLQSVSRTLAQLTADTVLWTGRVPNTTGAGQRYYGFRYTVVGSNPTLGTIIAAFNLDNQKAIV